MDVTPHGLSRSAGEGSLAQLPSPTTASSPQNFLSSGSQEQFGFHASEKKAAPLHPACSSQGCAIQLFFFEEHLLFPEV